MNNIEKGRLSEDSAAEIAYMAEHDGQSFPLVEKEEKGAVGKYMEDMKKLEDLEKQKKELLRILKQSYDMKESDLGQKYEAMIRYMDPKYAADFARLRSDIAELDEQIAEVRSHLGQESHD